jgi:ATP-dependent exoDNAse (exonuclease V) alpha subunit
VPGTGKTFVLDAVRKCWEQAGYRVIGTSLAGRAVRELESKAHIRSDTIAKLLADLEAKPLDSVKHDARQLARAAVGRQTIRESRLRLDAKTIVAVDESGMLDTVTFGRLVKHVAEAGAKIVFVGDAQQLPPIGAGGPFRTLLNRYESVQLNTIERQRDPRDVEAIHAFSRGDIAQALRNFEQRGLITVESNRKRAVERLVADWAKQGGVEQPQQHAILVCTNSDSLVLNDLCQKRRFEAGSLSSESYATIRRRHEV